MSFLEISNVSIGYNQPLIENINTTQSLGEMVLIIGDNGIGKTTLIKSLLKQIPLISGQIKIKGKSVNQLTAQEIAENIAVVFSKANVSPHLTVKDLVSLGKYIHYPHYFKLSKEDDAEVTQLIEDLGLTVYSKTPLHHLSDGNLQKAFIGRALAQNSPCIILDEPTTHLDETNKISILKLLRELAKTQNKLIILSSHDWRLAKEFADQVWFVKNKTLYSGITEDILSQHVELTSTHLFEFHPHFKPPYISAPKLASEMLYSFLQKNTSKDLSSYTFSHQNNIWTISGDNFQSKAQNFTEIGSIVENLH